MGYRVTIETPDGELVRYEVTRVEWRDDDTDVYWWTEGNASCDCNLAAFVARARGVPEEKIQEMETPCGETYRALWAELPNGRVVRLKGLVVP